MSDSQKCACEASEVLFFPCAGGSNCARIADRAAVELHNAGRGRLFCLAGIGGHVQGLIESAKAAKVLVAIDGCPLACARKTLEHAELAPDVHLVVSDLGVEKRSGHLEYTAEELDLCRKRVEQELEARVQVIAQPSA
jgi:uncharacterized metal-binding protein